MGGFRTGIWRRAAGALGLVGVLLYVSLIPNHFVSQTVNALIKAELGNVIICHSGSGPQKDGLKDNHCPFCHGYASFHLATLTSGLTFLVPPKASGTFLPPKNESSLRRATLTPQSRGPPSLSI